MSKAKINVTVQITDEMNERLVKLCEQERRSKTFIIAEALEKFLSEKGI
jgi:predicted transcriptional regulator